MGRRKSAGGATGTRVARSWAHFPAHSDAVAARLGPIDTRGRHTPVGTKRMAVGGVHHVKGSNILYHTAPKSAVRGLPRPLRPHAAPRSQNWQCPDARNNLRSEKHAENGHLQRWKAARTHTETARLSTQRAVGSLWGLPPTGSATKSPSCRAIRVLSVRYPLLHSKEWVVRDVAWSQGHQPGGWQWRQPAAVPGAAHQEVRKSGAGVAAGSPMFTARSSPTQRHVGMW